MDKWFVLVGEEPFRGFQRKKIKIKKKFFNSTKSLGQRKKNGAVHLKKTKVFILKWGGR